jgi:hypothetical protein
MTRDDIIQLAHKAGLHLATDVNWMPIIGLDYAEKFADLVAAAEREAVLDTIDELMGMERERHPMFSEGYDHALLHLKEFVSARGTK